MFESWEETTQDYHRAFEKVYTAYIDKCARYSELQKENKELAAKLNDALRKNASLYTLVWRDHDYAVSLQDKFKSLEKEIHDLTVRNDRLRNKNIELNKRWCDLKRKARSCFLITETELDELFEEIIRENRP